MGLERRATSTRQISLGQATATFGVGYAHAIPIKDRASLPNPMVEATLIPYRKVG